MAVNDQYRPGQAPFGMGNIASTGAPGSPGATEADALPDSAYTADVMMPYQSAQGTVPQVSVGLDDTARPGQNREGISGLGPDFIANTGAGQGGVPDRHPGARP